MATGTHTPAVTETKTVVVNEAVHTLHLNDREAQILHCLVSFTKDIDPNFPEVKQIFNALRAADAPEYFGMLEVAANDTNERVHVHIRER